MAASGKYITARNLIDRLTERTYVAMFDTNNTGQVSQVDDAQVQQVIDNAEAEVDSFLLTIRLLPLPATISPSIDRLVVLCCLDFAQGFAYELHPEYARQYGDGTKGETIMERARLRMQRIRAGIQELPDVDAQAGKPTNIGGIVYDAGPRTIVDGPDGTRNGGDL